MATILERFARPLMHPEPAAEPSSNQAGAVGVSSQPMALYAVAERRLRPGQLDSYLVALRALDAHLADRPARGPYTIYAAEADPEHVLGVGLWRAVEDLDDAKAAVSPELAAQLDATVADGEGSWD